VIIPARVVVVLLLLAACGETAPPSPDVAIGEGEPIPYDPEEAAALAARSDELRAVRMGDSGGQLRRVIPERLDVELQTPEEAWAYLTDPATPLPQRARAAHEAGKILPYTWVTRVAAARKLLQREKALHQWGRRASPTGALFPDEPRQWHRVKRVLRDTPDSERDRDILGHTWTLPREPQGFLPITWAERCEGPWPLQIEECLEELFRAWVPQPHVGTHRAASEEVEAWLDAVLQIPVEDEQDLWFFYQTTMHWPDTPDIRVFARLRELVLDRRFDDSVGRLLESAAGYVVRWEDRDAGLVGQAIVLDLWNSDLPPKRKQQTGYALRDLRGGSRGRLPAEPGRIWPATLMLEASRRGLDADEGDPWSRAYCYLFSVCETHPEPPFRPSRHEDPVDAEHYIEVFRVWFDENEAELERWAATETDEIERARQRLLEAQ
jgi:hypothetical protein